MDYSKKNVVIGTTVYKISIKQLLKHKEYRASFMEFNLVALYINICIYLAIKIKKDSPII